MSEVGINEVKPAGFRVEVKAFERPDRVGACTSQVTGDGACNHSRTFGFNSVHAQVLNELSGTPEKSRWVKRSVGKEHHE